MEDQEAAAAVQQYQDSMEDVEALLREEPDDADAIAVRHIHLTAEALQIRTELVEALAALQDAASESTAAAVAPDSAAAAGEPPAAEAVIGPTLPPEIPVAGKPSPATATAAGGIVAVAADVPAAKRRRTVTTGSGNARMHPGNAYAEEEPDFAALAARHPDLAPHVRIHPSGSGSVDFRSAAASRAVTRALLAEDYEVAWEVAEGQLIPPVPGRANYIAWLADLLTLSSPPGGEVVGLDIGCGANLIYPLLGASLHGWRFVAADITDVAIQDARANAARNPHLASLIKVRDVRAADDKAAAEAATACKTEAAAKAAPAAGGASTGDFLRGVLRPAVRPGERFAFSMCNPPFFESMEKAGLNPKTAHAGTAEEMVCPGGEGGFVAAMIADSLVLRERVHWYTTMLGRKASLKALRAQLHRHRPTALRTTEFAQGRTSRWGLAWSFAVNPNTATQSLVRQTRPARLAVVRTPQ